MNNASSSSSEQPSSFGGTIRIIDPQDGIDHTDWFIENLKTGGFDVESTRLVAEYLLRKVKIDGLDHLNTMGGLQCLRGWDGSYQGAHTDEIGVDPMDTIHFDTVSDIAVAGPTNAAGSSGPSSRESSPDGTEYDDDSTFNGFSPNRSMSRSNSPEPGMHGTDLDDANAQIAREWHPPMATPSQGSAARPVSSSTTVLWERGVTVASTSQDNNLRTIRVTTTTTRPTSHTTSTAVAPEEVRRTAEPGTLKKILQFLEQHFSFICFATYLTALFIYWVVHNKHYKLLMG